MAKNTFIFDATRIMAPYIRAAELTSRVCACLAEPLHKQGWEMDGYSIYFPNKHISEIDRHEDNIILATHIDWHREYPLSTIPVRIEVCDKSVTVFCMAGCPALQEVAKLPNGWPVMIDLDWVAVSERLVFIANRI